MAMYMAFEDKESWPGSAAETLQVSLAEQLSDQLNMHMHKLQ